MSMLLHHGIACKPLYFPKDEGAADWTWFADEDICRLADVPDWVKRQRKVSKKAAPGGYFTLAMLKQDCRIRKGMKGIDPDGTDRERAACEAAWFKAHPVMTVEIREKLKTGGEEKKELLHRARLKKMQSNIGPDELSGEKGSWIPLR
ncbi:MAG: hypothetical protein LBG45_04700 [Dysgonamonadaceae bacterium]|nr:hypothetical protein [Dysgonamonadaceae bacterium]